MGVFGCRGQHSAREEPKLLPSLKMVITLAHIGTLPDVSAFPMIYIPWRARLFFQTSQLLILDLMYRVDLPQKNVDAI